MKSRWQKSLEAAVVAYDTPLPWKRGDIRKAMIQRKQQKAVFARAPRNAETRRA